jgi:hypothetical protein
MSDDDSAALDKRRKELRDERRHVSGKVSDLCRFIGFGLLAVFYAVVVGETQFATTVTTKYWFLLYVMGIAGVLAIFFDYVQFACGERSVRDALKRPTQDYDDKAWAHWGRGKAFSVKQYATGIGSLCLLAIIVAMLFTPA